jgi:nitrous oxidase accessory protein NosD
LVTTQPIVINGQSNVTISGVRISNPNGHCITIQGGSQNITIQNSELGPCKGAGVSVSAATDVTIANTYIHDTTDNGVTVYNVNRITITDNRVERIMSGVYALQSNGVNIQFNNFLNVKGPFPRGQFVQFDKVSGVGNRVKCNVGQNVLGQSYPEDAINMYQSNGTSADPIQIIGNKIQGGGPSASGGGIMMGDDGGSYITVTDNILVDPGQYGMSVASGHDMMVSGNTVYARQQSFTNVGMSVWNQYAPSCYGVTVQNNSIKWTNSSGVSNGGWNAGNCGTVNGWATNNWNAPIDASVINTSIAACQSR